jgi:hypothetical protein
MGKDESFPRSFPQWSWKERWKGTWKGTIFPMPGKWSIDKCVLEHHDGMAFPFVDDDLALFYDGTAVAYDRPLWQSGVQKVIQGHADVIRCQDIEHRRDGRKIIILALTNQMYVYNLHC